MCCLLRWISRDGQLAGLFFRLKLSYMRLNGLSDRVPEIVGFGPPIQLNDGYPRRSSHVSFPISVTHSRAESGFSGALVRLYLYRTS